jgi:thiol-disulfide isomerase/thioredoxin
MSDQSPAKSAAPLARYLWLAALSALAAFAAVYVMLGRPDHESRVATAPQSPQQTANPAPSLVDPSENPLLTGAMTTFVFRKAPGKMPDVAFVNGEGKPASLKDFAGKVVLLNLWATWCGPCRQEMPALDRLQAALGSDKFQVVALAVDKAGVEGAKKFFADTGVKNLQVFADPTAQLGTELRVVGMPTTILLDKEGRELGRMIGPAAWDSAEAKRLVEAQM